MSEKALAGVKVVEYANFISGPFCTKLMADLGAEVIKVEKPGVGDEAREYGPFPNDVPHPERSGLFLFLNNLGTPTWDGFWMFYTDKLHWIPFYAVLFFFMYKKRNDKSIILTAVVVALMILFTDQITNLFKYGIARPRPCHEADVMVAMRLVKSWCGGAYGYFSGHASNSMAVAIFSELRA